MKKVIGSVFIGILVFGAMSLIGKNSEKSSAVDQYKVIKVNGKIIFQKTNSDMKQGDTYIEGTPLKFQTQESRAAVVSNAKGRCVISPSSKGDAKILPAANNVSSRSGALINLIDIQNHLSGDLLVIGKMELEIGEQAFPQNDKNFFYLTYSHEGELIRKKLNNNGNKVIFDKDEIFKVDGNPIAVEKKEMTLYYRDGSDSKKVSTFSPIFPNETELKSEVEIILSEYKDKSNDVKVEEVTAYLNQFYGKTTKDNLLVWLKEEFRL